MEHLRQILEAEDLPVQLAGFVNVDDLPDFYAASDMILHPSPPACDPHPLVMSEGACIGLPLVVSDRVSAAGATNIARSGQNATVFPMGDVAALEEELTTLARAPTRRAAMEANAWMFHLYRNLYYCWPSA